MTGHFITFEGGDGVGKTTQIARLAARLQEEGHGILCTREPGGTPGAEAIRALVVNGAADRWLPETDALLFMAARADHVARLIRPALAAGKTVLCDRFLHSTFAYQGGEGLPRESLLALHNFATGCLLPDLVLWLDLPPAIGLQRAAARTAGGTEARFESDSLAFHEKVRASFAQSAALDRRVRRIDASPGEEAVAAAIWAEVALLLGRVEEA